MPYKIIPPLTDKQIRRFYKRLRPQPNGCLQWTGKTTDGRGKINLSSISSGGTFLASRIAYVLAYNYPDISESMVCHSCDNPLCCNPYHLFLGTQADNMRDKAEKMRGLTKFTPEQVKEIRRLREKGWTLGMLRRKFNATRTTMRSIALRITWKFVD